MVLFLHLAPKKHYHIVFSIFSVSLSKALMTCFQFPVCAEVILPPQKAQNEFKNEEATLLFIVTYNLFYDTKSYPGPPLYQNSRPSGGEDVAGGWGAMWRVIIA